MLHQTSKLSFGEWFRCLDYSLDYKANKFCRLVFNCFVRAHTDILFKSWIEHIIPEDIKMTCVIDLFWLSSVSTECSRALKLLFDSFQCGGIIPNPQHLLKHNSTWGVTTWPETTQTHLTAGQRAKQHSLIREKTKNMLIQFYLKHMNINLATCYYTGCCTYRSSSEIKCPVRALNN